MKNKSRGWPSSERRNREFENEVNSWTNRVEDVTLRFLKYGAQFESAIIRPGYSELSCPDVVATMEYITWKENEFVLPVYVLYSIHTFIKKSADVPETENLAGKEALIGWASRCPNAGSADSVCTI